MANDVAGKIVRVTIAATYPDNQVEENSMGFICTGAAAADTRAALGAAVLALYDTNIKPVMATTASLYGYHVQTLMPQPIDTSHQLAAPVAGTGGAISLATQVRPVMTMTSTLGGRGGRGRLYIFTPDTGHINAATLFPSAALITAINALATGLVTPIAVGGSTWKLSIVHRIPGVPPARSTYTSILAVTANASERFGTIRKSGNYGRVNLNPW